MSPLEEHWYIIDWAQTLALDSVTIVAETNRACHLWLRYTLIEPEKHHNAIMRRGAPIGTHIDQCFVVGHDIEQNELGDTTTHTFAVPDWPVCQTRWFYLWGQQAGIDSPSLSPVFEKHNIGPTYVIKFHDCFTWL